MFPRAAVYSFAWDFIEEQKLDTVDQVLGKLPEFYAYLQDKNILPTEMSLPIFEDQVRRGWMIAQQEFGNPQARFFRDIQRQQRGF